MTNINCWKRSKKCIMEMRHAHETTHFLNFLFALKINCLAEDGLDPSTSGLWAQHTSAAPLCSQPLKKRLEVTIHGFGRHCLRPLGYCVNSMTNTNCWKRSKKCIMELRHAHETTLFFDFLFALKI